VPSELAKFSDEFKVLRREHAAGRVSLEGEWGFDNQWMPTQYKIAWLRVKADAVHHPHKTHANVIDYKSGRKFGNEIKHGEQLLLYAISVLIRTPELKTITSEDWYTDLNEITSTTYTRAEALRYVQSFDKRIRMMLAAKEFPANPNIFSCKFCPYGPAKGGQCEYGVGAGGLPATIKSYREKFG
jgi:CRISPR/Cas system-associated exonuclease Cas4 (RecB family)